MHDGGRDGGRGSARAREVAAGIVRALRDAGHEACFAGGCVRDELLGLDPTDYDVATDAVPDRIAALFRRTVGVGAAFGVVLVREQGVTVEVATFRADGPYTDRRRPDSVVFSDPVSDAKRRDFTINALFLDPLAPQAEWSPDPRGAPVHGRVIDHVGGLEDMRARIIRAVGDPEHRLQEDHLRALRGVRLAARLGFEIERATGEAIRAHASELTGVSRERIGDEVRKMLAHPTRAEAVRLLEAHHLDAPVFGPRGKGPAREAVAALGDTEPAPSVGLALAALAVDRGTPLDAGAARSLARRWRRLLMLSNEERDVLGATLEGAARLLGSWATCGVAAQKRDASSWWFEHALRLVRALEPEAADRIASRVRELASDGVGLRPDPLLDGEDLIKLGLSPGPIFARVLEQLYDSQLEGGIRSRGEAEQKAMELASAADV